MKSGGPKTTEDAERHRDEVGDGLQPLEYESGRR
jgi:hypothetical protein